MPTKTWNSAGNDYTVPGNWTPGPEPTLGDTAVFGSAGLGNTTVNIPSGDPEVDALQFNNGAYTLNLSTSLSLEVAGIQVTSGSSALINVLGGGEVDFLNSSSAGSATFVLGTLAPFVVFLAHSDGGTAAFSFVDNFGVVDLSHTSGPNGDGKITVGSIAGAGTVGLGTGQQLTIGGNNRSTVFTGSFATNVSGSDSLVKIGTGTLTLSDFNVGITITSMTIAGGVLDLASADAYNGTGLFTFAPAPNETLTLENAALPLDRFDPSIVGITWGDSLDLSGLSFQAGATASYDPSIHLLTVTNGTTEITLHDVEGAANQYFVLNDHAGGSRVMLAVVETRSRHQQFEHHEVGEKDVWLRGAYPLTLVIVLLASVAGEGRSDVFWQIGLLEELLELALLAVGERVHRIDHDRAGARRLTGVARPDRRIDDRYEEAERFAGPGASGHHEALPRGCLGDCLRLMAVKNDPLSVDAEYLSGVAMQRGVFDQSLDRRSALEMRVDGDKRLGPEAPASVERFNPSEDILRPNLSERTRKASVVDDQTPVEIEYVHATLAFTPTALAPKRPSRLQICRSNKG
jgi:hypothetical protein